MHAKNLTVRSQEPIHITCLSDLHIDEDLCDYDGLRELVESRRHLPNHSYVLIGDIYNLVFPPDLKRFRASVTPREVRGRDDWLDAAVEYVHDRLASLNIDIDLIGTGNHEDEVVKRHGVDVTSILASKLGAFRGGYSGVLDYRIVAGCNKERIKKTGGGSTARFRIVYHHGAWGGAYAKGYNGAVRFASMHDGWQVFLYGHNHSNRVDPEVRLRVNQSTGELVEYPVYYVNCGSWVKSYAENAKITHYAERKGYTRQARKAPLIKISAKNSGGLVSLSYSVET